MGKLRGFENAGEELLSEHGVKGLKYKAGQLTKNMDDARLATNYVIFDDKLIKVLEKYGIFGPVAVGAATTAGVSGLLQTMNQKQAGAYYERRSKNTRRHTWRRDNSRGLYGIPTDNLGALHRHLVCHSDLRNRNRARAFAEAALMMQRVAIVVCLSLIVSGCGYSRNIPKKLATRNNRRAGPKVGSEAVPPIWLCGRNRRAPQVYCAAL